MIPEPKFDSPTSSFSFYARAISESGVTCGVQAREDSTHGFHDLVLVVPCSMGMVCFNVESGAWNRMAFEEVQVPPSVYLGMVRMLSNTLSSNKHFTGKIYNDCKEKLRYVCSLNVEQK